MKIHIQNLGLIKETEVDIKPLTIFVGPNNAGKTWLAYALASIFGPWGLTNYLEECEAEEVVKQFELLDQVVRQVLATGTASFDLVEFADTYGEHYFNSMATFAQKKMFEFMGTQREDIDDLKISIRLGDTKRNFLENVLQMQVRNLFGTSPKEPLLSLRKDRGKKRLNIFISQQSISLSKDTEDITEGLPPEMQKEVIIDGVFTILHRALYNHVRILPTERTTYIAFPFPGAHLDEETSIVRPEAKRGEVRLAPAVGSFLGMIANTVENETRIYNRRLQAVKKDTYIKRYVELAEILEEQILGGNVIFSQQMLEMESAVSLVGGLPARHVLFEPAADIKLPISVASSMVKELSSLVLYLRYLAQPGELLVIDEPEMNLHPEAQVRMIEFLALLVNAGLKVLITTHSPYVVDHLANLLKASASADQERVSDLFYLKRAEAFLSSERVSVYLIEQGKATNMIEEDGVLELHTFGDVSERISDIFFQL